VVLEYHSRLVEIRIEYLDWHSMCFSRTALAEFLLMMDVNAHTAERAYGDMFPPEARWCD